MTVKSKSKSLDSEGDASSAEQRQSELNATVDANEKSDDGRSGKKESTAFKNYLVCFLTWTRLVNGSCINPLHFDRKSSPSTTEMDGYSTLSPSYA